MNTIPRVPLPDPDSPSTSSELDDLRQVHRVTSELRRGVPVLLHTGGSSGTPSVGQWLALLAAEVAGQAVLDDMVADAGGPPVLLLARRRAQSALGGVVAGSGPLAAFHIDQAPLRADLLRRLADPTLQQPAAELLTALLREAALPAGAQSAVQLAKIARLLPAVLAAPAGKLAASDLLRVGMSAVNAYPDMMTAGLRQVAEAEVPLDSAPDARVIAFRPIDGGIEHLAIMIGRPEREAAPLVRVHSACLTGDLLGSLRCDCGPQLRAALLRMSEAGAGVLLYLAQEGRGIGLVNKLRAYAVQDRGQDTVDANLSLGWEVDERSFLPAAIMLEQLGIARVRLLTNNPAKVAALAAHGIEVVARVPHVSPPNGVNDAYLRAKADRLGHLLG